MILYEHEAKVLLGTAGLVTTVSFLLNKKNWRKQLKEKSKKLAFPLYLKAQVLHGNRKLQGLITRVESLAELDPSIETLFSQHDRFNQPVTSILVEQAVDYDTQFFVSLRYATESRRLVLEISDQAGEGMDERGGTLRQQHLSVIAPPTKLDFFPELLPVVQKLWHVFVKNDALLIEINPLVFASNTLSSRASVERSVLPQTENEQLTLGVDIPDLSRTFSTSLGSTQDDKDMTHNFSCLDAKIELESTAGDRHPEWQDYPSRSVLGRAWTRAELQAHEVSACDHRGVAGESFFEFEGGDIGVMISGGGASHLLMDSFLASGLKPANYTEYSGNPTGEKVKKLTDVVLSLPNLKGLFVVGGNANFTDIYETIEGIVTSFLTSPYSRQPEFALLIRRGGPRWQEAFEMVEKELQGFPVRLKLLGPDFPLVDTVKEMRKLVVSDKPPQSGIRRNKSRVLQ